MQNQLREHHLKKGVQMTSPDTIYFSADTKIASNVRLEPNIVFGRNVSIAKDVVIKSFSYLEGVFIGKGAVIGPFARVRPTTYIGDESRIGNFVEVKNAKLSSHVKAGHLTYLGDASIGRNANIGAGRHHLQL